MGVNERYSRISLKPIMLIEIAHSLFKMRNHDISNHFTEGICDVNYSVRTTHIEATVLIAERMPRIDEHDIGSANLRQLSIDMFRAGHSFEDRIYSWYDGIGCRRHGLRRGGDDVATGVAFDTERPNPLDISGYHLGRHCVDGDAVLLGEFDDVDADIDFKKTEQEVVAGHCDHFIGNSEVPQNMSRHAAVFVDLIDTKSETSGVTVSTD